MKTRMTRLLFTGDWQLTAQNSDTLTEVVARILKVHERTPIDYFVHLGDIKHAYNPVDLRLAIWTKRTFEDLRARGIHCLINPGNHDRFSMHSSESWLPLFSQENGRGGSMVLVEDACKVKVDSFHIYCLPFDSNKDKTRDRIKDFADHSDPSRDLLIFHDDISGANYDSSGRPAETELKVDDFQPDKFAALIGGHIHLPQKLWSNVYYAGSPVAHDWGEVNQKKSFLVGEFNGRSWSFKRIPVGLPGLYDPLIKGFGETAPEDWSGHRVRIHVPVDAGINYQEVAASYRTKAESDYPGAEVVLVPQRMESKVTERIAATTDEELVKRYVSATAPPSISEQGQSIEQYLLYQLSKAAALSRASGRVSFVRGEARNFLSFEALDVEYDKTGVVVISGENLDWGGGQSNGSGKTNLLQLPAVALFGKTMKGQQFESWRRRGSTGECWVKLTLRLADGRLCEVFRGRQPRKLQVFVNGEDKSIGMGDRETQKVIETVTGLTWDTLAHGLYIDQQSTSRLVHGTDLERKTIFAQFLNLIRFSTAKDLVKVEIQKLGQREQEYQTNLELAQRDQERSEQALAGMPEVDLEALGERAQNCQAQIERVERFLAEATTKRNKAVGATEFAAQKTTLQYGKVTSAESKIRSLRGELGRLESRPTVCPTCGQPIQQEDLGAEIERLRTEVQKWVVYKDKLTKSHASLRQAHERLRKQSDALVGEVTKLQAERSRLRDQASVIVREVEAARKQQEVISSWRKILEGAKEQISLQTAALEFVTQERSILQYCEKAFSKDGLPSHLMGEVCPALNSAAALYSDIFTGGQLGATFKIDQSDLDVEVTNEHGGETLRDQSKGEMALATLVLSFALRDVLSLCDLLVLDEPGEGLDEPNARQFARGLLKVASRFPSVLLTSHNPFLLGELAGSRSILIQKKGGTSVWRSNMSIAS